MTIREKYRSYGEAKDRYVRKAIRRPWFEWCETSLADDRYDVAQGTCDAEDLPAHVLKKCLSCPPNGVYACRWPL